MIIGNFVSIELIPCCWIGLDQAMFWHIMNYMRNNISFQRFLEFGNMNNGLYTFTSSGVCAWKRWLFIWYFWFSHSLRKIYLLVSHSPQIKPGIYAPWYLLRWDKLLILKVEFPSWESSSVPKSFLPAMTAIPCW